MYVTVGIRVDAVILAEVKCYADYVYVPFFLVLFLCTLMNMVCTLHWIHTVTALQILKNRPGSHN